MGNKYTTETYYNYGKIFDELFDTTGTYIEDSNSNFNAHKLQVIKKFNRKQFNGSYSKL
ncbi:MAG: hypothetical protein ACLTXR_02175 [Clostridia bacterium]